MSDNIPFEIQTEIMKKLPVKPLIQFRTVSKAWKSTIDTSAFITHHTRQHMQKHHLLVKYNAPLNSDKTFVLVADNETFPRHKIFVPVPHLLNMVKYYCCVGSSEGLFCFYSGFEMCMAVLWNLSIRKAVGVVVPNVEHDGAFSTVLGFGVCRETNDPKIIKITHVDDWNAELDVESLSCCIPWQVEVFTLSTGAWRGPRGELPRKTLKFGNDSVVIDGVLYWLATEWYSTPDGYDYYNTIITFDLTSEEFGEICISDKLARLDDHCVSIKKIGKRFVMVERYWDDTGFGVWVMTFMGEGGLLNFYEKLFSVMSPDEDVPVSLKAFRKNCEPIIEKGSQLYVQENESEDIKSLEISEGARWISVYPYVESLLLHDQLDSVIFEKGKATLLNSDMQKAFEALL